MLRRSFALFSIVGSIALCWSACTSDVNLGAPTLIGRWEIEKATRNGRATESLDGLYMVFGTSNRFETNLSGVPEIGVYLQEEEVIKTEGVSLAMNYELALLTDSTMRLKSSYSNYRFDFSFLKVANLAEEETSK